MSQAEKWIAIRQCYFGPLGQAQYYNIGDELREGVCPGKYFINRSGSQGIKLSPRMTGDAIEAERDRVCDQLRMMDVELNRSSTTLEAPYTVLLQKLGRGGSCGTSDRDGPHETGAWQPLCTMCKL